MVTSRSVYSRVTDLEVSIRAAPGDGHLRSASHNRRVAIGSQAHVRRLDRPIPKRSAAKTLKKLLLRIDIGIRVNVDKVVRQNRGQRLEVVGDGGAEPALKIGRAHV